MERVVAAADDPALSDSRKELTMLPGKTIQLIALGTLSLGGLFAIGGCTSNTSEKPYALTGNETTVSDTERKERVRYTDDKGRYRADLRTAGYGPLH
jgi:hypothetical protein